MVGTHAAAPAAPLTAATAAPRDAATSAGPDTTHATLVCDFCNGRFTEDRAQPACRSCPLGAGCGKVRCPHCGYENVITPPWLERLRRWLDTHGKEAA